LAETKIKFLAETMNARLRDNANIGSKSKIVKNVYLNVCSQSFSRITGKNIVLCPNVLRPTKRVARYLKITSQK